MAVRYLVDSDWLVRHFRGHRETTRRLEELAPLGLAISRISLAELYAGAYRVRRREWGMMAIFDFLEDVAVLEVSDEVCRRFGREHARLKERAREVPPFDLLIAATALQHGLTLLINNRRHFERVHGLRIESL